MPSIRSSHLAIIAALAATPAEPIQPIAAAKPGNPALVALGQKLYFEPRLSKSGAISCNSCHNLGMGGIDGVPTSIGHGFQKGPRNAPTVYNAVFNGDYARAAVLSAVLGLVALGVFAVLRRGGRSAV